MALSWDQAVAKLVVALDTADASQVHGLVRTLTGRVGCFKVGLEAFTSLGPTIVEQLVAQGARVFLDLKLHDIPHTVERAAAACARLGVFMFNVHVAGGRQMLAAARAGAEAGTPPGAFRPLVLGVTLLTSLDEHALRELEIPGPPASTVLRWARLAREAGLDGVVCSAQELAPLRASLPRPFLLVTPGIRPAGSAPGDQKRTATPAAAVAAGADYLVVGRPITEAEDPAWAAEGVLREMMEGG